MCISVCLYIDRQREREEEERDKSILLYLYVNIYIYIERERERGSVLSVTVIVIGNGIGNPSQILEEAVCVTFHTNTIEKTWIHLFSLPALGK